MNQQAKLFQNHHKNAEFQGNCWKRFPIKAGNAALFVLTAAVFCLFRAQFSVRFRETGVTNRIPEKVFSIQELMGGNVFLPLVDGACNGVHLFYGAAAFRNQNPQFNFAAIFPIFAVGFFPGRFGDASSAALYTYQNVSYGIRHGMTPHASQNRCK